MALLVSFEERPNQIAFSRSTCSSLIRSQQLLTTTYYFEISFLISQRLIIEVMLSHHDGNWDMPFRFIRNESNQQFLFIVSNPNRTQSQH